jgi:predicted O-linked N-acetylglucosamine transferase (SPINDLY family)
MSETDEIETLFAEAVDRHNRGHFADAVKLYDAVIGLDSGAALAHSNRGAALSALARFDEALRSFDRAVEINPGSADVHNNRGNTLTALKRLDDAVCSYDRAIVLKPDHADAWYNRGNALKALDRLDDALRSYDRAIALKPDFAPAYNNKGNAFKDLKRWDAALECYEKAIALQPDIDFALGALIYAQTRICEFSDLEDKTQKLLRGIEQGRTVCTPFQMLAISDSPALQRRAAELYAGARQSECTPLPAIRRHPAHKKIRLGYFSADYHDHATMHLMVELFELHDRSRFELTAFSFGPDRSDAMRARAVRAFDRFVDVRHLPDTDAALLSRTLEVDIAVDLKGFTQDDRAGIFLSRAAPVQVSYLGYPGTMGADAIDYIVADPIVVAEESRSYYRERIVYLPNSYQINDRKRAPSNRAFTRAGLGLPPEGFVFCCFNNNYKITPPVFDCWMRILKRSKGSMLWLLEDNAQAARNLKKEATARGIDEQRLIFAERLPPGDHLARLHLADLFLDTLPYNAHTTASEALWAGLPLLTCRGQSFASRVAASLLHAVGLPELVTTTLADYETRALEIAGDPGALASLRQKLAQNRLVAPLFDSKLFTRHIEAAYAAMYERNRAGLPPADIHVSAS